MVSSTVGSFTITGWNRRSRAGSFSIYCRYSSRVVAPMQWSSPRASMGFSRFPASMEPSVFPAPTMVCSSSMNRRIFPSDFFTSARTAFSRSSNSPPGTWPLQSGPHVQGEDGLVLQILGTSPDNPLGQALGDSGFAHAGLADEYRIIFGLPAQNPDHIPDLSSRPMTGSIFFFSWPGAPGPCRTFQGLRYPPGCQR